MAVGARAPGVVDAARVAREIAAAVHGQDLEVGVALQHAVEDQVVQRDGGLERIADHVVEVEARQTLGVREAVGVDDDEGAELLGLLPERGEGGVAELVAVDVSEDLHALEAELGDATLELLGGLAAVGHRHACRSP